MTGGAASVARVEYVDLLACPWKLGGRWEAEGDSIDCWGVVVEVRRRLGLACPDPFRASSGENAELSEAILEEFAKGWERVPTPTVPGDVACFHSFAGHNTHAAVHLGGRLMLHAGKRFGVQAQRWATLRRHASAVYRLRGDV